MGKIRDLRHIVGLQAWSKQSRFSSRSPRRRAPKSRLAARPLTGIFHDNKHVILMMPKQRRPWTKPPLYGTTGKNRPKPKYRTDVSFVSVPSTSKLYHFMKFRSKIKLCVWLMRLRMIPKLKKLTYIIVVTRVGIPGTERKCSLFFLSARWIFEELC